jgi:hypothetical protein
VRTKTQSAPGSFFLSGCLCLKLNLVTNFHPLKNFLFALFAAVIVFAGCQKDTNASVSLQSSDLAAINSQLKGTWLFPVQTLSVVDNSGKILSPAKKMPAPAFQFDGSTKVNIMPDLSTVLKGTYELTTKNGFIYLNVTYPDKTSVTFQVLLVSNQILKLTSTAPYTYLDANNKPLQGNSVINTQLKRQNSADVTGSFISVSVVNDSLFNVGVYVTHLGVDTATLLNTKQMGTGTYNYAFLGKHGDHLTIDLLGSITDANLYAYYKGIPLTGEVNAEPNEIKTNRGWNLP